MTWPVAGTLADAAVEIIAELDQFEPDLRRKLTEAVQSAANDAEREFKKAGNKAGKAFGDAVAKASEKKLTDLRRQIIALEQSAAKAGDAQATAAGKVRVAEARLADVLGRKKVNLAQVAAAEEALAAAQRKSAAASDTARLATQALTNARQQLVVESQAAGRRAGEALGEEFRRAVETNATKAGTDGGNFFSRAFETAAARAVGQGLLKVAAVGVASFITALTPLSTILGGAGAGVVALAAALTQAAGAGIALGGVLGSVGLAAAAVKVGTIGLSDALKAQTKAFAEFDAEGKVSKKTQEDLAAAMKNLAPAAREVVVAIGAQRGAWKSLRQAVQQSLFAGVGADIQRLANTFLPILKAQLTGTASTLNEAGRAFVRFITSGEQSRRIAQILTGLNIILSQLLPVLFPLADAFLTLFQASLPFALQLVTALGGLATKLAAFAEGVTKSGEFTTFMKGAFEAAKLLFGILGNLAGIITTIFAAGSESGVGLLSVINNLLTKFRQFLNSADGQEALGSFFSLINEAGSALIAIFSTLSPVVRGLSSVFKALEAPIKSLGAALVPVIGTLALAVGEALTELAPQLAALVVAVTPLITAIGGSLVEGFSALLTAILPVIPVLVQLVAGFVTGLVPQFAAAGPIITTVVEAFGLLITALVPLLEALLPLIPVFAQLVLAQIQLQLALLPLVTQIFEVAAAFLTALLPGIQAVVEMMVPFIAIFAFLITKLAEVVAAVVDFVGLVTAEFSRLIAEGTPLISAFVQAVAAGFLRLVQLAAPYVAAFVAFVLRKLQELLASAVATAGQIGTGIVKAVARGLGDLGNAFAQPFRDAQSAVEGAMQSILDAVNGFIDRIQGAVSRIGGIIAGIPRPSFPGFNFPGINIPGLANGGLTRGVSIAGEAGPEVVIPMTKPRRRDELLERYFGGWAEQKAWQGGGGYGGRTREINMPVHVTGLSKDETVQVLTGVLENRLGPHIGINTSGGIL